MFPPLLATLAMAKEGEQKTILQDYVSSISAQEFLLGKILAFMVIAVAECLLGLLLLFTYFGLGLAGDPTAFIVATLLYAFCVASFGTMIGAAIPSQAAAMRPRPGHQVDYDTLYTLRELGRRAVSLDGENTRHDTH